MKKIFLSLTILSFFSIFTYGFSFSIEPIFTYNNDILCYRLYDGSRLNSRLDWDSSYLFKGGAGLNFEFKNLSIYNSHLFALPLKCGHMYDSDWYTEGIKTNYATSDLYSNFSYDFYLEAKYKFYLPYDFTIAPVVSFYDYYSNFSGKNTLCWCGDSAHTGLWYDYPWNSENAVLVKQYGIDFKNNIAMTFFGTELQKSFNKFSLNLKAQISPFTYISSIDHHLNNKEGRYFLLIQKAYFTAFNVYLNGTYSLNSRNHLNLGINICGCPQTHGIFYFGTQKSSENLADETCSFEFYKFALKISWTTAIK